MRTRNTLSWWIALVMLSLSLGLEAAFGALAEDAASPKIQTMGQYTRIQIPLGNGATFRLLGGSGKDTKIQLSRVQMTGLRALPELRDQRVQSIQVDRQGSDQAELTVRFNEDGTESFAYLQGQPPVLVLDLWQQKKAEVSSGKVIAAVKASKPAGMAKKKEPIRKLASIPTEEKQNNENGPTSLGPLRMDRDIFQRILLQMPELSVSQKGKHLSLPPKLDIDSMWTFSGKKTGTDDDKSYEFAKRLYKEEKFGLTIKTIEITLRDHPQSNLADELRLLQALSYKKLGETTKTQSLVERAQQMLTEMAQKRDENGMPLPFHNMLRMYFGEKAFLESNWLDAISHLEYVAKATETSNPDFPYIQMLLAESYIKVNDPRRAERLFRFLAEHFPKHILAKEALYRAVDLLAMEKNYGRVVENGAEAIEVYPEYEKTRSEVLFQMGEACFWLGKYAQSEKYFRRFIDLGSNNTVSGLAWVRIGEIAEILKKDLVAAREAYQTAKDGFPFSAGAVSAEIRLARLGLSREKDPEFVVKSLTATMKDQAVDWDMRRAAELVLVDYLMLLNRGEEAIGIARNGMKSTEGSPYEAYKAAYVRALYGKWKDLVTKKKFTAALSLYNQEGKWLELIGAEASKTGAEMYRGIGLYETSNALMEKYVHELRGKSGGRGLASSASLNLTKAKNSFSRGAYAEALALLPTDKKSRNFIYESCF